MLYVHVAQSHPRPLPVHMSDAATGEVDPDLRALLMLGARATDTGITAVRPWDLRAPRRGKGVAKVAEAGA